MQPDGRAPSKALASSSVMVVLVKCDALVDTIHKVTDPDTLAAIIVSALPVLFPKQQECTDYVPGATKLAAVSSTHLAYSISRHVSVAAMVREPNTVAFDSACAGDRWCLAAEIHVCVGCPTKLVDETN